MSDHQTFVSSVIRSAFIPAIGGETISFLPFVGADATSEASSGFYIVEFKVECEASFSNFNNVFEIRGLRCECEIEGGVGVQSEL